jgi:hypothetical protein
MRFGFFHLRSNLAQSHAGVDGRPVKAQEVSAGAKRQTRQSSTKDGARGGFTSHFCLFIIMHEIMSSAKLTIMQFT